MKKKLYKFIKEICENIITEQKKREKMSYGLFIRLPDEFAKHFPKKEEDSSPPHITMLIINSNVADKNKIIKLLRSEFNNFEKFKVKFDGIGYFKTPDEENENKLSSVVSYAKIIFEPEIRPWKGYFWVKLEKEGIEVNDKFPDFVPHATLSYDNDVSSSFEWDGYVPNGEFEVSEIELWDGDYITKFKLKG